MYICYWTLFSDNTNNVAHQQLPFKWSHLFSNSTNRIRIVLIESFHLNDHIFRFCLTSIFVLVTVTNSMPATGKWLYTYWRVFVVVSSQRVFSMVLFTLNKALTFTQKLWRRLWNRCLHCFVISPSGFLYTVVNTRPKILDSYFVFTWK